MSNIKYKEGVMINQYVMDYWEKTNIGIHRKLITGFVYLYISQDLLLVTIDTSVVTIEWAMSELMKNPEIIRKATKELDKVIGRNRWVEEKDMVNLPYIKAITKESMRLHRAAAMLPPMTSAVNGDSKVLGYDIPGGAQVIVNVWAIGRDPAIWENPNEFNPKRFIGKDIDVIGHHFELLPFGAGRRICPGYALGLKVVQVSLANLVHGFSWSMPDHMKEEDLNMEEAFRLTTIRKQPLEAVIKPRLSSHRLSLASDNMYSPLVLNVEPNLQYNLVCVRVIAQAAKQSHIDDEVDPSVRKSSREKCLPWKLRE